MNNVEKAKQSYEGLEPYKAGYLDGYDDGFNDCTKAIIEYMKAFLERQNNKKDD